MAWLEITVNTASKDVEDVAARLTARGYADLVIEDQAEFESFLEENRAYWDYIDDEFQKKLAANHCNWNIVNFFSIRIFYFKIPGAGRNSICIKK